MRAGPRPAVRADSGDVPPAPRARPGQQVPEDERQRPFWLWEAGARVPRSALGLRSGGRAGGCRKPCGVGAHAGRLLAVSSGESLGLSQLWVLSLEMAHISQLTGGFSASWRSSWPRQALPWRSSYIELLTCVPGLGSRVGGIWLGHSQPRILPE